MARTRSVFSFTIVTPKDWPRVRTEADGLLSQLRHFFDFLLTCQGGCVTRQRNWDTS